MDMACGLTKRCSLWFVCFTSIEIECSRIAGKRSGRRLKGRNGKDNVLCIVIMYSYYSMCSVLARVCSAFRQKITQLTS